MKAQKADNYIFRRIGIKVLPAIIVAFLNISVFAVTLAEYRAHLESASASVSALLSNARKTSQSDPRDLDLENSIVSDIRKNLPASEKVEWNGSSAETGNQWLYDNLAAFQSEKDQTKRIAILVEVDGRISALLGKVKELEKPPAEGRSKDEDKQKLGEILQREEYQPPSKEDESLFQRWFRQFMEWLESVFPRVQTPETSGTGFQSFGFVLQILLFAAILGGIGFLLYKFAPSLFGRFGGSVKRSKKDRVILGEHIAAEESAESLFGEAERLAREGNLRGAIRKGYIALLCELSDRKVIGLAQHKTNRDYLRDVRSRGELFQNMNGMTSSFERHWYGFQPAETSDWDEFRQRFRKAIETGPS
jgi:Domain of unknown function (DUF4129)